MRVLFVIQNMKIGGVQKALLNLTKELISRGVSVEYFIIDPDGKLIDDIPKSVKILTPNKKTSYLIKLYYTTYKEVLKTKNLYKILKKTLCSILSRIGLRGKLHQYMLRKIDDVNSYDIAISFDGMPNIADDLVFYKAKHCKKVTWIHSDVTKFNLKQKFVQTHYSRFDAVAIVSKVCKDKFLSLVPQLSSKSFVVYNTFDVDNIRKQADEYNPYDSFDGLTFVTVARMHNNSKRLDRIISVCSMLKKDGVTNYRLYMVGDGPDLQNYISMVKQYKLEEYIYFTGNKINPYPYIKNADVFVMSSQYEGYPMTLIETLVLRVPVITTGFDVAYEVIQNNVTGIITDLCDLELYKQIKNVIMNPKVLNEFKKNISSLNISNSVPIEQFNEMINKIKV